MKRVLKLILILLFITGCSNSKVDSHNFFYMDTYINVKIYDAENTDSIFKEVDKIYKEYHELADRYHEYEGLKNVYYLKNNDSTDEIIKLDSKLCNMIKLGLDYNKKTNGSFNINMSNILDVWKNYREKGEGIPTLEELNEAKNKINLIILNDKCELSNNHPSIDLGAIAKGYATEKVGEYLRENKVNKFIINAGGNVLVGDHYNNDKFKIGLEKPDQTKEIYKVLKLNNKSVVTSGGYERFYTYEGKNYHHIIDYNTMYPANYFKSVTIITKDSGLADTLSTCLFLMPIEEGKKLIKDLEVDVIWYTVDDKVVTTEGIKNYE